MTIPKISLHNSDIEQQHRLILCQPTTGLGLRQGQVTDLIGRHMPLGMIDPPSAMTAIAGGLIAPVAVSSAHRYQGLPDVPTFAEEGLPGFEATGWFGIVAPAGTSNDVIAKINTAFVTALKDPAIVERIRSLGSDPMPMAPDEFSRFLKSEAKKWETVVAKVGQK